MTGEPTPEERRALAEERDKLAADWDALADATDEHGTGAGQRWSAARRAGLRAWSRRPRPAEARERAAPARTADDRDTANAHAAELSSEISGLQDALQTRLAISVRPRDC